MITPRQIATFITGATTIACISGMNLLNIPLNHLAIHPSIAATLSPDPDIKAAFNVDFSSVALADALTTAQAGINYVPPNRGNPTSGSTTGAGSRGCGEDSQPVSLSLLTPRDHIGQTASAHPTFFWYVSNATNVPVKFTLVEPKVAKPVLVKQMQVNKAGIMRLEMPTDSPELVPGRQYRWTVALVCASGGGPSNKIVAQSWIKRVAIAPSQSTQLAAATSERDRAQIYAQGQLWYDALNSLAKAYATEPNDQSIRNDLLTLLKQVGLTQITAQSWQ